MHMKIAKRQRFINLTLSPDHNFFPFFSFFLFKILKKKKPQIFKFIFLLTFFVEEISLQFLSVVGAVDSLQTVVFFLQLFKLSSFDNFSFQLGFCNRARVSIAIVSMEPRVGNKFRLGRKIGSGSFGEIYLGLFNSSL